MVRSISRCMIPVIAAMPFIAAPLSSCDPTINEEAVNYINKTKTELKEGIKADSIEKLEAIQALNGINMPKLKMERDSAINEIKKAKADWDFTKEAGLSQNTVDEAYKKYENVKANAEICIDRYDSARKIEEAARGESLQEKKKMLALYNNETFEHVLYHLLSEYGYTLKNSNTLSNYYVDGYGRARAGNRYVLDLDYNECVNPKNTTFHIYPLFYGHIKDISGSYINRENKRIEYKVIFTER